MQLSRLDAFKQLADYLSANKQVFCYLLLSHFNLNKKLVALLRFCSAFRCIECSSFYSLILHVVYLFIIISYIFISSWI